MIHVGKLFLTAFTSAIAIGLWKLFHLIYPNQFTSPIRHLRGPKGKSWIYGNAGDVWDVLKDSVLLEDWIKQYGSTLKFKGFFNSNWLFTVDTRAINHVLAHSTDYPMPLQFSYSLAEITGKGLLFVEGAQHRQQRRVMNPAFGPAQIRSLTIVFLEKAIRLRHVLSFEITKDPFGSTIGVRIDIIPWLGRMTLDIIGLADFNCNSDCLNANERPNELHEAFTTLVAAGEKVSIFAMLQARYPLVRLLPSARARRVQAAQRTMARIDKELLSSAKSAALASAAENGEKNSFQGQDLFSLLVKANMATEMPESRRLSDEDVLAQVPTFVGASYGTTSIAITWALYAIAKAPGIQTKLREEFLSVDTETPSTDELMALPCLDAVVRETLRVYSPVSPTVRIATKDDVMPVEKPYKDNNGIVHNSIRINKGDPIYISILAINRSRELWRPDAHEFKPERWDNVPEATSQIPGVWSYILSFLGGPRACIGYRFAVVEMKAVLFTLIRAFELELAVPDSEIGKRSLLIQWPVLRSDPHRRPQLPLLLKSYK